MKYKKGYLKNEILEYILIILIYNIKMISK